MEELSARLSLMAAVSTPNTPTNEKGEFICEQQQQQQSSSDPANYLNNRCVYLEQLLSGKIFKYMYIIPTYVHKNYTTSLQKRHKIT